MLWFNDKWRRSYGQKWDVCVFTHCSFTAWTVSICHQPGDQTWQGGWRVTDSCAFFFYPVLHAFIFNILIFHNIFRIFEQQSFLTSDVYQENVYFGDRLFFFFFFTNVWLHDITMCCVRFLQMVCDYYHREVNDRRFLISITRPNENICTRCIVMATALCVGQKLKSQAAGERVMFCVRLNYRVHVWQISQTGLGFWKKKKTKKNRERERTKKIKC